MPTCDHPLHICDYSLCSKIPHIPEHYDHVSFVPGVHPSLPHARDGHQCHRVLSSNKKSVPVRYGHTQPLVYTHAFIYSSRMLSLPSPHIAAPPICTFLVQRSSWKLMEKRVSFVTHLCVPVTYAEIPCFSLLYKQKHHLLLLLVSFVHFTITSQTTYVLS